MLGAKQALDENCKISNIKFSILPSNKRDEGNPAKEIPIENHFLFVER